MTTLTPIKPASTNSAQAAQTQPRSKQTFAEKRALRAVQTTLAEKVYGRNSAYPPRITPVVYNTFPKCKLNKDPIGEGTFSKALVMEYTNPTTQKLEKRVLKLVKPEANPTNKLNSTLFALRRSRIGGEWHALHHFGPHVLLTTHALALDHKTKKFLLVTAEEFQEISENLKKHKGLHYTLLGTVSEYIDGSKTLNQIGKPSTDKIRIFAKQLLEGLKDIHAHFIIHRDLKPENILVSNDGTLKIMDLGFSRLAQQGRKRHSRVGSPAFLAPELLLDEGYNHAADIYSLGITLLFMTTSIHSLCDENGNSFDTLSQLHLYHSDEEEKGKHLFLNDVDDEKLRNLIEGLIKRTPEERLTTQQALNHPFFQENA